MYVQCNCRLAPILYRSALPLRACGCAHHTWTCLTPACALAALRAALSASTLQRVFERDFAATVEERGGVIVVHGGCAKRGDPPVVRNKLDQCARVHSFSFLELEDSADAAAYIGKPESELEVFMSRHLAQDGARRSGSAGDGGGARASISSGGAGRSSTSGGGGGDRSSSGGGGAGATFDAAVSSGGGASAPLYPKRCAAETAGDDSSSPPSGDTAKSPAASASWPACAYVSAARRRWRRRPRPAQQQPQRQRQRRQRQRTCAPRRTWRQQRRGRQRPAQAAR
jgi:hypothetical protein